MKPTAHTIPEALRTCAERGVGEYVFQLEEGAARLPCLELAERAELTARRLVALGVRPGDPVGVLGANRPEWVVSAFAIWLAGGVLVPLQFPLRIRDPEALAEQLRSLVEAAGCKVVLAEPRLAPHLPDEVAVPWDDLPAAPSSESLSETSPDDPAVIQFTSGSTAVPRGALVTHAAVMAQMRILDEYMAVEGVGRTTVSWTPYFHDLGLFMNVIPAAVWGLTSHHLLTARFAGNPVEWFRLAADARASFTLAPASAFGYALRRLKRRGERVDLGAMEVARFGTEGVDPNVIRRLEEQAPRLNLRPEALGSSYGLAETVLAVTLSPPGSGLRIDRISLDALAADKVAYPAEAGPARELVGCGPPRLPLRIVGPEGDLPERHVGEIQVRGASLMSHYVGDGAPDPFVEGWLRTGDLGYLADGELYVAGRAKDLMIAMGHNYYPEDFEWAATRVEGVRPGRCIAFGEPGAEHVIVLVEAADGASAEDLSRQVKRKIADAIGVTPTKVAVLPPGSLEKTTSGKLRRAAMRDAYLSGALQSAHASI